MRMLPVVDRRVPASEVPGDPRTQKQQRVPIPAGTGPDPMAGVLAGPVVVHHRVDQLEGGARDILSTRCGRGKKIDHGYDLLLQSAHMSP